MPELCGQLVRRPQTGPTAALGSRAPQQSHSPVCAPAPPSLQHLPSAAVSLPGAWPAGSPAAGKAGPQRASVAGVSSWWQEHHDPFTARKSRRPGPMPAPAPPGSCSTEHWPERPSSGHDSGKPLSPGPPNPTLSTQLLFPQPPCVHLPFALAGAGLRSAVLPWSCTGPARGPVGASRPLQAEGRHPVT